MRRPCISGKIYSSYMHDICISICVYWGFPFLMRSVRLSVYDGSV